MRKLFVCPSTMAPGYSSYSPIALKHLFNGKKVSPYLDFNFDDDDNRKKVILNMKSISSSGLQEKFSGLLDGCHIRLTNKNEQGTYLLKPIPWDYSYSMYKQTPANEHLTMQIASQVYGIQTVANGLCFTANGQPVYITRRFDLNSDSNKYAIEDFAVLVGKDEQSNGANFKFDGSYADIAEKIKQYIPAWMIAMERFFRIVIFNYLYGNGGAHLKNFSVLRRNNEYLLAPAYDLLNTSVQFNDNVFGLKEELSPCLEKSEVYNQTGYPCIDDFIHFGQLIGLKKKRIETILNPFMDISSEVFSLIERSFMDNRTKRKYLCVVKERYLKFVCNPNLVKMKH